VMSTTSWYILSPPRMITCPFSVSVQTVHYSQRYEERRSGYMANIVQQETSRSGRTSFLYHRDCAAVYLLRTRLAV
jgi:hypothetical protein